MKKLIRSGKPFVPMQSESPTDEQIERYLLLLAQARKMSPVNQEWWDELVTFVLIHGPAMANELYHLRKK